MQQDC